MQTGTCLWFNQGCTIGCDHCTGDDCGGVGCCKSKMEPTLDPKLRTYNDVKITPIIPHKFDVYKHNPWRAPGHAPIESPCGIAGGWYKQGKPGNGGIPPKGIPQGFDGRKLNTTTVTKWAAGSQQEVAWSIDANHGGGYSYRLCPKWENLTEECFQANSLKFVGDTSWIQYGSTAVPQGKANRTAIPAMRTTNGTKPEGSEWTRNPIPACNGIRGGALMEPSCTEPQFPPPMDAPAFKIREGMTQPGLYGFGLNRCISHIPGRPLEDCNPIETEHWAERFNFNIIDLVQVPASLPAGDYVLGFRWDCEQSPQIWADCADIEITKPVDIHV